MGKAAASARPLSRVHLGLVCAAFALAAAGVALVFTLALDLRRNSPARQDLTAIVGQVAGESAAVADRYLGSVEAATKQMAGWTTAPGTDDAAIDAALISLVAAYDYFDGAYVGYPDGSFVYAHREGATAFDGFRRKRIGSDGTADGETARQVVFDIDLTPLATVVDEDLYDPRTRPWYAAATSSGMAWTEPYVFHSSQEIGVTHAAAVGRGGEVQAVIGIDLRLDELTSFLDERRPSDSSVVAVTDLAGRIIARSTTVENRAIERSVPEVLASISPPSEYLSEPKVDVHSFPDLGAVIAAVAQPVGPERPWHLVVVAPEEDFAPGGRTAEHRTVTLLLLLGALGIGAMALAVVSATAYVRRLHGLATFDPLTGLLRRSAAIAALDRLLSTVGQEQSVSVMVLDLDGFKAINDGSGHESGDQVLQRVAERLSAAAGDEGTVGRLGGDEFIVIAAQPPHTALFSERSPVMATIEQPMLVGEGTTTLAASAGVSHSTPEEQKSPAQLLREADVALYNAKDRHRRGILHYESEMQLRSSRDAERRQSLERAISAGLFDVHFQPEIDLLTGEAVGAEALLRLRRPDGTPLEADAFVADLERFDLLDDLLPTVFERSSELASSYQHRPFSLRINLAAEQLANQQLESLLIRAMDVAPHASYCLELTERSVISVSEETIHTLRRVRSMGVSVALDDFGTGHASLTQLHRLPIDTIKIDRSFVDHLRTNPAEWSVASAVVKLGAMLNIEVVAEGIETADQHLTLRDLGCRSGQGYLFGRAVPAKAFLDQWPPHPPRPERDYLDRSEFQSLRSLPSGTSDSE